MKIRTEDDILNRLDEILIWRKKELTYIRKSLTHSKSDFEEKINIRISITLLYAHFEGFIKEASIAYLDFLNNQKIKLRDIEVCFKSLRYYKEINNIIFSKDNKFNCFIDFIYSIPEYENDIFSISPEKCVSTNSNLNSTIFKEINNKLGLHYDQFILKEKLIDSHLLDKRNKIAHGEYYPILTRDQTNELFDEVVFILDNFKTEIVNSVASKSYFITHNDTQNE